MARIPESELMLNGDGSIYHLNILPDDVANIVILVGDPERVERVSQHFDSVDVKKNKREFITHTGMLGRTRLSVISTGIGTDNIDIVLNELDALVNIDLKRREVKDQLTTLRIIRIGTSGALQPDIPVDSFLLSEWAIGLDGLMRFYERDSLHLDALESFLAQAEGVSGFYLAPASTELIKLFPADWPRGITVTCPGFYGPQGRKLRASLSHPSLLDDLRKYRGQLRITNLEMETAGIYALGRSLGHQCLSLNAIVTNRVTKEFSKNPEGTIDRLIEEVLAVVAKLT